MGKIISTPETLERVKQAKAGDASVYINWEAVSELPAEYDIQISKIDFNIEKDFSDVGNNTFMPTPALHYIIADAKGISGQGNAQVSPIYENVNINYMNMKEEYRMLNIIVGYRCTKQSNVMTEDGTLRFSSPCTNDYNVWNRCSELWSKEEMYTDGYTKSGKFPNKYDTKWKRMAHFNSEMKFAAAKAETKAFEKTIRELAGLMTGYTKEELKEGSWYFARVRRSSDIMKLETAARLTALERGESGEVAPKNILFGTDEPEPTPVPEPQDVTPEPEKTQVEKVSEVFQESKVSMMARVLKKYATDNDVSKDIPDYKKVTGIIDWLEKNPDIEQGNNQRWFNDALEIVKGIEKGLPDFLKEKHNLY